MDHQNTAFLRIVDAMNVEAGDDLYQMNYRPVSHMKKSHAHETLRDPLPVRPRLVASRCAHRYLLNVLSQQKNVPS